MTDQERATLTTLLERWRQKAELFKGWAREANHDGNQVLDAHRDSKSMTFSECASELEMAFRQDGAAMRLKSERGAELIEFALACPLLLLIVLGIVDFGFLFQRLEVVTNAAREGARVSVLPGYQAADVRSRINDYLRNGGVPIVAGTNPAIDVIGPTMITLPHTGHKVQAMAVNVRFTQQYMFLGPLMNLFGGSQTVPLSAVATMRCEAGGCP